MKTEQLEYDYLKTLQHKDQTLYQKFLYEQFSDYPQRTYFAEEHFQITERYIPTSYGQIYSITAGSPGQPLILIVHGSGPKNSSAQYNYLLQEYLVRVSYLQKFYLVAIDCPGYGKSIGSKQAVKTFPLQMFEEILKSLNYKSYYAMYGHSQGGAAIFNAVYQNPSLAQILVMDRPVCGNIQRFRKFNIPTLLIYDIEDDGHPIWQGKLLYKELSYSELYTYRNSQDTYWVPDNIWTKMLEFFARYSNNRKGRPNIFAQSRAVSLQPFIKSKEKPKKKAKQQNQSKPSQTKPEKPIQKPKAQKKPSSLSSQKPHKKSFSLDERKNEMNKTSNLFKPNRKQQLFDVEELQMQKEEMISLYSKSMSDDEKKELRKIEEEMKEKEIELMKDEEKKKGLTDEERQNPYKSNENIIIENIKPESFQNTKPKATLTQQIKNQQDQPLKQTNSQQPQQPQQPTINFSQQHRCAICYQTYYRPMQTNCNHSFCTKCLLQSLLVNTKCPLCRGQITKKTEQKELHHKILQKMTPAQIQRRQKAYLKLKLMLDSIVMIEVGNRSIQLQTKQSHFSKTKKKYMWELFVKKKPSFKFQEVSFNVNMGDPYSKPVKVKQAPFVFESRGTFSFTCEIIIKPRNNQYAPLTVIHRIDIQPGTHKQVVAFRKKIYLKNE